ncbi:MAG: hypothetical protein K2M46_04190 [Lachnospiraceae bacterium]|nr:hypothetical protein [Lachnospiraceae bacterium]
MKLKALEILNIYGALEALADKELDLNTSCTIARNLKELLTVKETFEKKRDAITMEYAEKDEEGNFVQVENGIKIKDVAAFNEKITKLLNTVIEVTISHISKSALDGVKVSPKDIFPLIDFLDE